MNLRERFRAIMSYESLDRTPLWYLGTWLETKARWQVEGMGVSVACGPLREARTS